MRFRDSGPNKQRGVVAIITGLAMVVLVGFAGLALDGGRLYLTKTELQNAADACALAAAYELTGSPIPADNFTRAVNSGQAVGAGNRVGFQGAAIEEADIDVEFSPTLDGPWVSAGSASGSSKYVRCTIAEDEINPWFMQVMGFDAQIVRALATASLSPAQNNCAIPIGYCTPPGGTAPDFGYVKGDWYSMNFEESGTSAENLTGNFRWLDFDPSSQTPGCSGGGAQELACLMEGAGQCELPPLGPSACSTSGNSNPVPGCVGQTGSIQSLGKAYNSRFGICQGAACSDGDLKSAPPDFSGLAYSDLSWPERKNAFRGASATGLENFAAARSAHLPVQDTELSGGMKSATKDQLIKFGADRRVVVVPFVDCENFAGGQHAPIRGYACVLMLAPYKKVGSAVVIETEYLGAANVAGSPCATSGLPGSPASVGPMVPSLVQ